MPADPEPYLVHWSEKAAGLVEVARDEQDWYETLASALLRPADRTAVDVGCGGGGMTLALAAALGPAGSVVAVDSTPEVLDAVGEQLAGYQPGADTRAPVQLVAADLGDGAQPVREALPQPADLVWASASVHHVGDQQRAVDALAGLLAPDGRLALVEGGLGPYYLPWDLGIGEPGLEQRLHAANDRWFAGMRAQLPGTVRMPYGWTEALRRAGLTDITTRSSLQEQSPPLPEPGRQRIADQLGRWVDRLREAQLLTRPDLEAWDRLLDPDGPAWLGHRNDLYRLRARSVHLGTRPRSPGPTGDV